MKKKIVKINTQSDKSNPIIISGITRSGKAMMMEIISSFNNVEKCTMNIIMEQPYYLHQIKKINIESAIYLLRKSYSVLSSNLILGRDLNFKKDDYTSIFNFKDPKLYLRRINERIKKNKIENLKRNIYIPLMLHYAAPSYDLLTKSFPKAKIIDMNKNPIELAFSWIKKNLGGNNYKNSNNMITTLKYKNKYLPFYVLGWEDKYLKLSKFDRVVAAIKFLDKKKKIQLSKLDNSQKKRILKIYFDQFVNKKNSIEKLEKFLKLKKTNYTLKVLKKNNCPRDIFTKELDIKRKFLKTKLSKKYFEQIVKMEEEYLRNYNYNLKSPKF